MSNEKGTNVKKTTIGVIILLILFIVAPLLIPGYWKDALVLFVINVILVISYRLIITMGGWSFAHVVLMGFGGFISALLTTKFFHWSFWLVLPIGGLAAALFAFAISYPVLRTRGFYFFLSTFAAGEALRQCFIRFRRLFGGIEGIAFIERPTPLIGIDFVNQTNYYYLVLAIAIISGIVMYRINKSRIGLVVGAIRTNESLSEAVGINTWGYKSLMFVVGSFFAGIAGVLFAHYNGFIVPTDLSTGFMFKIVASAILGGTNTFAGPIVGLLLVTLSQEILRDLQEWLPLVYGSLIICVLLFLPKGVESTFSVISKLFGKESE